MGVRDKNRGTTQPKVGATRGEAPATYRVIEGFSGPGGMSLGLHQAGFQIACAFDHDARAVDTHNRNLGGRAFVADAGRPR